MQNTRFAALLLLLAFGQLALGIVLSYADNMGLSVFLKTYPSLRQVNRRTGQMCSKRS